MTLRYVYGIVPAAAAGAIGPAALRGIDGTTVRSVTEAGLAAAVSDVDGEAYAGDALNERIADLDWLAERATAHQGVNARLLELAGTVLPLAFGALYRDDERVREMLREDAPGRIARLERLAGRGEWLVTIVRDAGSPSDDDALRGLDREIAASAPGRAFLLEKRRGEVAARAAERADADAARAALARLGAAAERSYEEPVAGGGPDVVVLRVSLLAPRDARPAIDHAVRATEGELAPRGYRLRVTGPWPAYRFGSLP